MKTNIRPLLLVLCMIGFPAWTVVLEEEVAIEGDYVKMTISPEQGAVIDSLSLKAVAGDFAGAGGLLEEGFGVPSYYVPNRRLNAKLETVDDGSGRPVLRYSYDCDGANIKGLKVSRTIEPLPDEASVRVRLRVANEGGQRQWVAPWARNSVAPGGSFGSEDLINVPTEDGVIEAKQTAYHVAARNWIAVTDSIEQVTFLGVFDAGDLLAFLTEPETDAPDAAIQAAFVPRVMGPGDVWETTYRLSVVRGLKHVDFATDELAAQLDYTPGQLQLLMAPVKEIADVVVHASVLAENGRVWRLEPQRFDRIDPNRLVRCRFDWTPPGDGTYDFLAQLKHSGGDTISLGQETASPHGGIDTVFVIGDKGSEPVQEPWTEAPQALQRGARQLSRSMISAGPVHAWIEDSLEKVFEEDVPEPDGHLQPVARVSMARRERESFQVILHPPKGNDLIEVKVALPDLVNGETGARIPASCLRCFRVGYVPVRVPSFFEGPTGEWPDVLRPFEPFTAKADQCSPLWFTVYAPPGTPAGVYAGKAAITSLRSAPIAFTIEARVHDFDLPVTPSLKTDFGFWAEAALDGRGGGGASKEAVVAAYLRNALEHRVTLRDIVQLPPEEVNSGLDLQKLAPQYAKLLEQGVSTLAVPRDLVEKPELLRAVNEFVRRNNLQDRAFCQVADRPDPAGWERLVEGMQLWKDLAPDIPMMATSFGLQPFLPDLLDIWAVHTQMLDTVNNKVILEGVSEGREVWWYVNYAPPRPYANFLVDFAGIEHRVLFWQTWALGIKGLHYWGANYYQPGHDPYDGTTDPTPVNGDGLLVYPGAEGPVDSIRWEIIRDGIEDYDYLTILTERTRRLKEMGGAEILLQRAANALNLTETVPDLVRFSRDPKQLRERREAIASAIIEVGKAL